MYPALRTLNLLRYSISKISGKNKDPRSSCHSYLCENYVITPEKNPALHAFCLARDELSLPTEVVCPGSHCHVTAIEPDSKY